ncbi:carbamate kinase [candidate division KSB3 bacterium]|uniref:Carbamate kinase n=1 Tax=candidate division KSB3 bacterium TaxID=2044937 RepID=A0A2G6E4D3_9BACT|nr:MAG: carbamate kinase [candidate division KSB3 bacterium]PIE29508.1 MAG: carbamate kinase [candidate division KSB3 bacterium]
MKQQQKIAVLALGGNAIMQKSEEGNIHQQFANTRKTLDGIMELIERGYRLVITHGNGPQVGNLFLMVEATRDIVPSVPLGLCVADTQGQMGYMIQQSLQNRLIREGHSLPVISLVTQVVVDREDPSFKTPTKPIGPFYTKEEGENIRQERGWKIVEDSGRGYRLVVPSPQPTAIVESAIIQMLLEDEVIVIAAGGGGIPVICHENGAYEGVDAVVDKDAASSILATELKADLLLILTGVDQVAINFNTPDERFFDCLSVNEAQAYLEQGHFPPGSMGPKISAAIDFIKQGGQEVLITSLEKVGDALQGKSGTRIV